MLDVIFRDSSQPKRWQSGGRKAVIKIVCSFLPDAFGEDTKDRWGTSTTRGTLESGTVQFGSESIVEK